MARRRQHAYFFSSLRLLPRDMRLPSRPLAAFTALPAMPRLLLAMLLRSFSRLLRALRRHFVDTTYIYGY